MGEDELVELFAEGGHHDGEDGSEGACAEEELMFVSWRYSWMELVYGLWDQRYQELVRI